MDTRCSRGFVGVLPAGAISPALVWVGTVEQAAILEAKEFSEMVEPELHKGGGGPSAPPAAPAPPRPRGSQSNSIAAQAGTRRRRRGIESTILSGMDLGMGGGSILGG